MQIMYIDVKYIFVYHVWTMLCCWYQMLLLLLFVHYLYFVLKLNVWRHL